MTFQRVREQPIPDLKLVLQEFVDPRSGMRHFHLATDDPNQAFALALPTPTDNNDGRPHILEHLALCGSQRFPVRDPFMAMTQRSLASFMNAMTYTDRTVYPFASPDETDYLGLMDVYLDAVFFPRLSRLDFLQEGWRHTLDDQGRLRYDGVVFNEMKGALTGRERIAEHALDAALLPGTPYRVISGGTPEAIPTLTHESLLAFHRNHYHPSQAVVFSYGHLDPTVIHARLNGVLARCPDLTPVRAKPAACSTLTRPMRQVIAVPDAGENGDDKAHSLSMAWVLGPTHHAHEGLIAQFMGLVLMDEDDSPLQQAMSQASFGRPGELSMARTDDAIATWVVSMDGLTEAQIPEAERLILSVLESVAEQGISTESVQAKLDVMELAFRDVGNGCPTGVELILNMVPAALAGADPALTFDPDVWAGLSEQLRRPGFVAQWVRERLLNNPQQVLLHQVPDPDWLNRRERLLTEQLEATQQRMAPEEIQRLHLQGDELMAHQNQTPDFDCLPCVELTGVSRTPRSLLPHQETPASSFKTAHLHVDAATGGIARLQVQIDLTPLPKSERFLVSQVARLLTQVGLTDVSWEQAAMWRGLLAAQMNTDILTLTSRKPPCSPLFQACLSAIHLDRKADGLPPAIVRSLLHADFSNHDRLSFLLEQQADLLRAEIGAPGIGVANLESRKGVTRKGRLDAELGGRMVIQKLEELIRRLDENSDGTIAEIQQAHQTLLALPRRVVSIGGDVARTAGQALAESLGGRVAIAPVMGSNEGPPEGAQDDPFVVQHSSELLTGSTSIHYCYQTWEGPASGHPDFPVLAVLAQWIGHAFLLPAVREKGSAYGVRMVVDDGLLQMRSYRDPRLTETFSDFDEAVSWAGRQEPSEEALHQAKLGVLKGLVAPMSPANAALWTVGQVLGGVPETERAAFQEGVLDATAAQLRRVARAWLTGTPVSRVAFTSQEKAESLPDWIRVPLVPPLPAPTNSRRPPAP